VAVSAYGSARVALVERSGVVDVTVEGSPEDGDPRPVTAADLFDLASVTKVVTAMAALALWDDGALDLDEPVAAHLPVSDPAMTPRSLLAHTAGLPDSNLDWRAGRTGASLMERCLASQVTDAGTHRYSCVGYIVLGALVETVARVSLDRLVASRIAAPAGAAGLRYGPVLRDAAVATEVRPDGSLVRGGVHDELAAAIGRPVGNAGLFGSVADVHAVARVIRDDGAGAAGRVLSAAAVELMTTPTVAADGYGQAAGLRVDEGAWMGRSADGARRVGHTGFTGTALAVDRGTGDVGVLLTNRVHPARTDPEGIRALRREFFGEAFG
jgi:CubicO group peptidase (beta-lactamase class C family)